MYISVDISREMTKILTFMEPDVRILLCVYFQSFASIP